LLSLASPSSPIGHCAQSRHGWIDLVRPSTARFARAQDEEFL
jgi:hypothetical protein